MTEPVAQKRRKAPRKGATLNVAYALCFVFAVGASAAVIYTGNDTLMRFGLVFALWAALGWAFIADQSRRKAELVSAKASDYKLIYDLQLEREIAARHHYELSLESELRRQLTAEADTATHTALAELQQQVAVLRGQLQELLDQDLEYDQPALRARATRLDELLVAKQSLGATEPQPRKRAAQAQDDAVSPRLWLPSQSDRARPEQPAAPSHADQQREPHAPRQQPPAQQPSEPEPEPEVDQVAQSGILSQSPAEPPQPAAEPSRHDVQQAVWPQQTQAWAQDQQWQQTSWEAPAAPEPQRRPAGWQQPKTPPVTATDPAAADGQPVDYPSWYSPSAADPSHAARPQPQAAVQESGESPGKHEQRDAGPQPRPEASHGRAEKSKHADKSDRAKPAESRGGRRAKPVRDVGFPEQEHGAEGGAVAADTLAPDTSTPDALAPDASAADSVPGAHASGHSVNELLSRLSPDEAAGYHGRRRRGRGQGATVSDEDVR